jgi:peptidoglycan/LPS O-acetylase OafA/YrhL
LRAIAIAWVMVFHAMTMGLIPETNLVALNGWMGVDLFFALSGFLIGGQLFRPLARHEPQRHGLFYARRLFRTLPPYLVVLALYLTLPPFRERPLMQPVWQFLTFTENLFIDSRGGKAFSHVWSLCIEEQFYLVAPLVVWLLMRWPSAARAISVCAGVVTFGVAWRAYVWLHDMAPLQHIAGGAGDFSRLWQERIYYSTPSRLDGLLFGVMFALIKAFRPALWGALMRRSNLVLGAGAALVAVALVLNVQLQALIPTVIGFPILSLGMACLVAAGASEHSLIGRWPIPGAGLVAAMAYSLYLTHKEAYHLVGLAVGAGLDHRPVVAALAYGAAALALGGLLYVAIERPSLRLRDRLLGFAPSQPGQAKSGASLAETLHAET